MPALTAIPGPTLTDEGVFYSVWAPGRQVIVEVHPSASHPGRSIPLHPNPDGFHEGLDPEGEAGDRYELRLSAAEIYPCPASRWQPDGIHGPSMVIDPRGFDWSEWARPPFRDLVIYELHLGTFSPEGTFLGAIEKLGELQELGVNAIELMPICDFPGRWNWGYDGVRLFAPAHVYGTPDELRRLVNEAHLHGIAIILDVVYNHFGPDGNYLHRFSRDYFESRHHTPWGEAINFDGERSEAVRAYFCSNLVYWMEEFHIDGFRLDATHTIFDESPKHILAEMAEVIHARGGYIIAEDERNQCQLIEAPEGGGFGLDAVWADDFHHSVEAALIDASWYRREYEGELHELVEALQHGWLYQGNPRKGNRPGTPCSHLPPQQFVFCLSNHDQAGNRAFGERMNHLVSPETYRAASALLCLSPYTPLLFMGQEWSASTPFLYFTDHYPELGRLVEEGRRRSMLRMPLLDPTRVLQEMPRAQAQESFENSKLNWEEVKRGSHAACRTLYRELLALRREHAAFRPMDRAQTQVAELQCGILALRAQEQNDEWLVLCDLRGKHRGQLSGEPFCQLAAGRSWRQWISSNALRFGGTGTVSYDQESTRLIFTLPEVLVLRASG